MTLTNEARHRKWHEASKCICRLDKIICNSKQPWNKDKCRCECKKLVDKGVCDKEYFFSPSNCDCQCDKSCGVGEYLDYPNCNCKKNLIDPLVKKCIANIDKAKLVNKTLEKNENKDQCSSYVVYKVLFWIYFIFFVISTEIGIYFTYYKYMNHNKKMFLDMITLIEQQFIKLINGNCQRS